MSGSAPWQAGDHEARRAGYLLEPGSPVLRNKVGATTVDNLRAAENDLLEFRLAELRTRVSLIPRTYDLAHLQRLHLQLFQDIYEWAGELRTVGLAKGGGEDTSFMPPLEIERPVAHVASRIADSRQLRDIPDDGLVIEVTYLYDYLNFAHPFREGNGRVQREFFAQLLAETGRGLHWARIEMDELHAACHLARTDGDTGPLSHILELVLFDDPGY